MQNLGSFLDSLTSPGELYQKLENDNLRCTACAHRCLIRPGKRGICQVRFNQEGELRVPWGYVAALQADPIEKKPFSHVLPGATALTFGMLGCDLHCDYCFTPETIVVTEQYGPKTLESCFEHCERVEQRANAIIGYPDNLFVISASGKPRKAQAVFQHHYRGNLIEIQPYYLPVLRCTPEHRVFAVSDVTLQPELIHAANLTPKHYLVIPRHYLFSNLQTIDTVDILSRCQPEYQIPWNLTEKEMELITNPKEPRKTSRELGLLLGKSPSYIRHVRSKFRRNRVQTSRIAKVIEAAGMVRFTNEHKPGIPSQLEFDEEIACLFGWYCAEGSTIQDKNRPNSLNVVFSFSPTEDEQAKHVRLLLARKFGLTALVTRQPTRLAVSITKSSFGLLMKSLAGGKATEKRVPQPVFQSKANVVEAFLNAFVDGDGHRYPNGKVSITTVSRELAHGIAWLVLKLGYVPALYETEMPATGVIQGRPIHRAPYQYTVVWYQQNLIRQKMKTCDDYYLIPLRRIRTLEYDGPVFNMQVEGEHNYLAGFFAVSNCQNWRTSQAMRDPAAAVAGNLVRRVTPDEVVKLARRNDAEVVVSSYNEPLITSEWSVSIFKKAKSAGLMCAFVSNGNATPEALEYLRPWLDAYKVDLKSMQEKNYRRLGAVLKNVLETIERARALGLWVEVVTLLVPGFNDSNEELYEAARFLRSVSADIPWHVTAFHPDYKMTDRDYTPPRTLIRAAEIGREAGLNYVYAGNLPGMVEDYESTYCPHCSRLLVRRQGYVVTAYHITGEGRCQYCGTRIAGLWPGNLNQVRLHGAGVPFSVK